MDDDEAADYVDTLPELCRQMLLRAHSKQWTRPDVSIDISQHPFVSINSVVKYLESANLAECRQGRMGNRFDHLIVRLNDRGEYLKQYMKKLDHR